MASPKALPPLRPLAPLGRPANQRSRSSGVGGCGVRGGAARVAPTSAAASLAVAAGGQHPETAMQQTQRKLNADLAARSKSRLASQDLQEQGVADFSGFESWTIPVITKGAGKGKNITIPVSLSIQFRSVLQSHEEGAFLDATIVQTILCCAPRDPEGTLRYFKFRFDSMHLSDEAIQHRRSTRGSSDGVLFSRHIFSARLPLDEDVCFNNYPFIIQTIGVSIDLTSFEHGNTTFKPKLAFPPEVTRNQELFRNFYVKDPRPDIFDQCHAFDFITPHPSLQIAGSSVDIRFFVTLPNRKNTMTNVVPIIIIMLQNLLNVWITQDPSDFLGNSSGIALNLVILLPMMYPDVNNHPNFSFNDIGVAIVLISVVVGLAKIFHSPIGLQFEGHDLLTLHDQGFEAADLDVVIFGWIYPICMSALCALYFAVLLLSYNHYVDKQKTVLALNGGIDGIANVNVPAVESQMLRLESKQKLPSGQASRSGSKHDGNRSQRPFRMVPSAAKKSRGFDEDQEHKMVLLEKKTSICFGYVKETKQLHRKRVHGSIRLNGVL